VQKLAEDVREEDKTPLGIACSQSDLEMVSVLIDAGALDVNNACVEKAAKAHHHALVHLLLTRGKISFCLVLFEFTLNCFWGYH
jgi:ankyrin repeat protein